MDEEKFIQKLFAEHRALDQRITPDAVCHLINHLLQLLFPALSDTEYKDVVAFDHDFKAFRRSLLKLLDELNDVMEPSPDEVEWAFFQKIPGIKDALEQDATAILSGDPAAITKDEVIRSYPGFYALAIYRVAHALVELKVPMIPRILTEYAHGKTGVDIHPSAKIGQRFCIDHGTGLVIGETVEIGDDVKIYQGVTLGALSVSKAMAKIKRHPTIQDRVVIYAGATILGGNTIIGHDSIIGGNVWITKSIAPFSRIYYKASNFEKADRNKEIPDSIEDQPKNRLREGDRDSEQHASDGR